MSLTWLKAQAIVWILEINVVFRHIICVIDILLHLDVVVEDQDRVAFQRRVDIRIVLALNGDILKTLKYFIIFN